MTDTEMPSMDIVIEATKYVARLKGTRPMLNLYPADTKISKSIRECARIWHGAKEVHWRAIDDFLRQLFEALADDDVDTEAVLNDIKKHAGMGYSSGGVSGTNHYSSDKSRVDGKLIRRKRR